MESIKYRAIRCAAKCLEWCFSKDSHKENDNGVTDAIADALVEQRNIDIEKACKWLAERKCWDFYDDVEANTFREEDIEEFRKYMEG